MISLGWTRQKPNDRCQTESQSARLDGGLVTRAWAPAWKEQLAVRGRCGRAGAGGRGGSDWLRGARTGGLEGAAYCGQRVAVMEGGGIESRLSAIHSDVCFGALGGPLLECVLR